MTTDANRQQGFAVAESILIFIVILLVAGVGAYVWHANTAANKILRDGVHTAKQVPLPSPITATACSTDTYTGKQASIGDGALTFCSPDSWVLAVNSDNYGVDMVGYDLSKSAVAPDLIPIVLSYSKTAGPKVTAMQSVAPPVLTKGTDLSVAAYTHQVTASETAATNAYSSGRTGAKDYDYFITMHGAEPTYLRVAYTQAPGAPDVSALVRDLVSTISMSPDMQM